MGDDTHRYETDGAIFETVHNVDETNSKMADICGPVPGSRMSDLLYHLNLHMMNIAKMVQDREGVIPAMVIAVYGVTEAGQMITTCSRFVQAEGATFEMAVGKVLETSPQFLIIGAPSFDEDGAKHMIILVVTPTGVAQFLSVRTRGGSLDPIGVRFQPVAPLGGGRFNELQEGYRLGWIDRLSWDPTDHWDERWTPHAPNSAAHFADGAEEKFGVFEVAVQDRMDLEFGVEDRAYRAWLLYGVNPEAGEAASEEICLTCPAGIPHCLAEAKRTGAHALIIRLFGETVIVPRMGMTSKEVMDSVEEDIGVDSGGSFRAGPSPAETSLLWVAYRFSGTQSVLQCKIGKDGPEGMPEVLDHPPLIPQLRDLELSWERWVRSSEIDA